MATIDTEDRESDAGERSDSRTVEIVVNSRKVAVPKRITRSQILAARNLDPTFDLFRVEDDDEIRIEDDEPFRVKGCEIFVATPSLDPS